MLAEFGVWWLERMTELLAANRHGAGPSDTLLLHWPTGNLAVVNAVRRRRGRRQDLGRFTLPGDAAQLRALPRRGETVTLGVDVHLLARSVTLPLAAEQGLATFLRYEMDRLTPFMATDVVWDWRLVRRDRVRATLEADLVLLPRVAVAPQLLAIEEAGLRVTAIEAPLPGGTVRALPLEPPDPVLAQRRRRQMAAAWAVCAALAGACMAVPLVRVFLALQSVNAQIAELRPAVNEAQALQRRISGGGSGGDAISVGRHRTGDVLKALAALTDALPDDTYLTELAMDQGRLTMEGQTSKSASRLIAALAADQRLRGPGFSAPVVRGDGGIEIFALQAELVR